MSAPRANKEDKKKKLGSRRSKAKQNEPQEADDINFMDSVSVVQQHIPEENPELSHISNPEKSETESQHQPLAEHTEKRRKLGSSRINKGRQRAKDPETEPYHEPRGVGEKTVGSEGPETTHASWDMQFEEQEDVNQAREPDMSAAHGSSLQSVSRSDQAVLRETRTADSLLSKKVKENTQTDELSESTLLSSVHQQHIKQSNLKTMPKEERFKIDSTAEKANTERGEDTDVPPLDGNVLSTSLMSESHSRVLEVCATAEINDHTELPADEAQCEGSSASLASQPAGTSRRVAASEEELSGAEEPNEHVNFTDIVENINVSPGNQKNEAEFTDRQESELKSLDNVGTRQEGSNPDKKSVTRETILQPLEHMSEDYDDCDSTEPHIREQTDTGLSQVNEVEWHLEQDVKSTSHEQKEGEEPEPQVHSTSQTQENVTASEEKMGDFSLNKGHVSVKDMIEHNRTIEGLETTKDSSALQTIRQEETTQETVDNSMSASDDSSLYLSMPGSSEVQNPTTIQCPDSDLGGLIETSENVQEANNENEAAFKVETLEGSSDRAAEADAQSEDHYLSEKNDATGNFKINSVNSQTKDTNQCELAFKSTDDSEYDPPAKGSDCKTVDQENVDDHVYELKEVQTTDIEEHGDAGLFQMTENQIEDKKPTEPTQTGHQGENEPWKLGVHTEPECSTEQVRLSSLIQEEQNEHLSEARGAQASDDAGDEVHEQDVKQTQMHVAQDAEIAFFSVRPTHQAELMDTQQNNTEALDLISDYHGNNTKKPEAGDTGADTEQSVESLESWGQVEEAEHTNHQEGAFYEVKESVCSQMLGPDIHTPVQPQTQDNSSSVDEQESTDLKLRRNKRKMGSRRKNKGQQQVKDSDETSTETVLEETGTAQPKDDERDEEEDAHTDTSHLTPTDVHAVTHDQQAMDQSHLHVDECPHQSSATDTESNETDKDTDLIEPEGTLQTKGCEAALKPGGSKPSATLEKTTEKSSREEETHPEGRVEQTALSSPKKEMSVNKTVLLSEATGTINTAHVQEISDILSVQTQSEVHAAVDSQPLDRSHNDKEETHTSFKSAEHRRKLGSNRRTKGKQHVLDSASQTDHRRHDDVGNTWDDDACETATDTMRQEEIKQQPDAGANASEEIRRNINDGETTGKIREDTTSSHNVREHSITETTEVTSRPDGGEVLPSSEEEHKHMEESENPTKNEQTKASEAVETTRLSAEKFSKETVGDVIKSVTHDGLESLSHESDTFQEKHEEKETDLKDTMAVESAGVKSDGLRGKDGSTTQEDVSHSDTKQDSLTEENVTKVLDQIDRDLHASDEVKPETNDAETVPTGSSLLNTTESQEGDGANAPAEQTRHLEKEGPLQPEIHVSVSPQTQDRSVSTEEQNSKDFKSMGSRRKLGSSRRSQGNQQGRNSKSYQTPTAEVRNAVCAEQSDTSMGLVQEARDTAQTEELHDQAGTEALVDLPEATNSSRRTSWTVDQQLKDQSDSAVLLHHQEHSHVSASDTESSEREKDTVCFKSSVTMERSRGETCPEEVTEPDRSVEQAALSSPTKEEQSEREVTVAQHMENAARKVHDEELKVAETQEMNTADDNGSSSRQSDVHAPLVSQPLDRSHNDKEETHTSFKSAEHRRKLGSSRRTKGKQHVLDSRPDKDEIIEESENLTLLTGKPDSLEDMETVPTETQQNRKQQLSLGSQLFPPNTEDAVNPEYGIRCETGRSVSKDEPGPEALEVTQGQALKPADVPGADVEITDRGSAVGEQKNVQASDHEPNDVNEGATNTNAEMRNASPSFNSSSRRRKMGSTRRNLGSPSKREHWNQEQEVDTGKPETAGDVGDGSTWPQPHREQQDGSEQREEKEGEERHITESQLKPERNPDSLSLLVETQLHVNEDHLATKLSTSPKDITTESSHGGRRRKLGSSRKSHGNANYQDHTAREGTIVEQGGELKTHDGAGGEESVLLDKLAQTSNTQVSESDKKLSSTISSAGESRRPGSEKGPKQVTPHVGIYLGHESQRNISFAGDSTEADVRSASYNVMMVGDTNVGKTSFMKRAQSGKFSLDLPSSVGLDSCKWTVVVDGKRVVLHLWDTAGQERFHSITRQILHKAHAFLLMYDITSSKSFSAVSYWANCIQEGAAENVSILLLGNKSDGEERQVKTQEGEILAKEYNFEFMECSAATGQNVIESLEAMARTLTQRADARQEAVVLKQEPQKQRSGCC